MHRVIGGCSAPEKFDLTPLGRSAMEDRRRTTSIVDIKGSPR